MMLEFLPEPHRGAEVAMTHASREFIGASIGDVVRVEYDGNAVQRRVTKAPLMALRVEKSGKIPRPIILLSSDDWDLLGLPNVSSYDEALGLRVRAAIADEPIEMP